MYFSIQQIIIVYNLLDSHLITIHKNTYLNYINYIICTKETYYRTYTYIKIYQPMISKRNLSKLNTPLCNSITYLRAGIHTEEFYHILSFRHIVIKNVDLSRFPVSILNSHGGIRYTIFLSNNSVTHFFCISQGHISF